MNELLKKLRYINSDIRRDVPTINYGGCSFYATMIERRLAELGHTSSPVVLFDAMPHGADHVATSVVIDGVRYFHDGEDTLPWEHKYDDFAPLTMDPLTYTNSNKWNTWFEPRLSLPVVEHIITRHLGEFTKGFNFDTLQGVQYFAGERNHAIA
jgi:hypothetical protein